MTDVEAAVRDPQRLAALRRLVLLDSPPAEPFDRLVRLAARVLRAPVALITLIDEDRQYFKAQFGLPEPLASARQTALEYSICQYAVAAGRPFVICDAAVEHWLDDNPAVREWGVRSYAGAPIVTADGHAVGTLCVLDLTPREWTDEDLANLDDLAAMTVDQIRLHRIDRRIAHQREWRGVTGPGLGTSW